MTPKKTGARPQADNDAALDKALAHEDIQHGSAQSIPKEGALKRTVQQHPRRDVPRVESIEPSEAPPRE